MVFLACCAFAGAREGAVLTYQLKVQGSPGAPWAESQFRVVTSPVAVTHNKVKKPRMSRWRLEPVSGDGLPAGSALLARVEGLLYYSGPTPGLVLTASGMTLGGHFCRLWQAPTPQGVAAYAYLAEVAPNLLALSYLSVSLKEPELSGLELHLLSVDLGDRPSPAEEGTALLRTLARWGVPAAGALEKVTETLESEEID